MSRKHVLTTVIILFMICSISTNLLAYGESFSCSYGKKAACLDYNDIVCSSSSKCVSYDAICFDSYTCNYKGFTCKSKFDTVVDEYDDLLRKYRNLADEYDELVNNYNNLRTGYNDLGYDYDDLEDCVSNAYTLEEAQMCY